MINVTSKPDVSTMVIVTGPTLQFYYSSSPHKKDIQNKSNHNYSFKLTFSAKQSFQNINYPKKQNATISFLLQNMSCACHNFFLGNVRGKKRPPLNVTGVASSLHFEPKKSKEKMISFVSLGTKKIPVSPVCQKGPSCQKKLFYKVCKSLGGGLHGTEVEFALLTQLPQVWVSALPIFLWMILMLLRFINVAGKRKADRGLMLIEPS